jgi:hypothetical protein
MSDEDPERDAEGNAVPTILMVARSIARALWLPEFKAAHPEAGPEEIKAAWKSERYIRSKPVRQALKSLEKRGFQIIAPVVMPEEDSD